ncbi:MAG: hypothetical protein FWE24_10675 [Defluviitaleaceae bacterium]|nr:hypothetical protein [Defluviitaleaceae bacterium]
MAKSRTEKIASYDEQIANLQKKRSEELDKQKQEEKDEREKRQRKRGEILEKLIPETVTLTVEQFTALLNKTTANPFGRDKLAEIIKEGEAKSKPQAIPTPQPQSPQHEKPNQPTNADDRKN